VGWARVPSAAGRRSGNGAVEQLRTEVDGSVVIVDVEGELEVGQLTIITID